jgi:Spy/CpxP family protein refolding chaperone
MKRISTLAAILFLVGCVQMYAQEAGMAPSPKKSQQLKQAEAPAPCSEELACLPPDGCEMGMPPQEGDDAPPQEFEEAGVMPEPHDGAVVSPGILGKLKLTDAQKKEIDKLVFDAAKQAIAQRAKVATARLELRQLLKADNPEKNAIEKKINEIADLSTQTHIDRIDGWFAVNKLLTPEQQKIWKRALADRPKMGAQKNAVHFSEGRQRPQANRHARANGDAPCPQQQQQPVQQ